MQKIDLLELKDYEYVVANLDNFKLRKDNISIILD